MAKRASKAYTDPLERIVKAALELGAQQGWRETRMADIAEASGLSLNEVYKLTPSKMQIVSAFLRELDGQMIAGNDPAIASEPARDRLFDVIMLRSEAMEEYRAGLMSLMAYRDRTPSLLLTLPLARKRSADWALVSAGLDNRSGAPVGLKSVAIGYVIAKAERAWRKETSGDFARTMAALDKGLRDAEDRMEQLQRFTGWGKNKTRQDNTADEETKPEET